MAIDLIRVAMRVGFEYCSTHTHTQNLHTEFVKVGQ